MVPAMDAIHEYFLPNVSAKIVRSHGSLFHVDGYAEHGGIMGVR